MSEDLKKILEEHETRISKLERLLSPEKSEIAKKKMSIKEFIIEKRPKGDVQKTLTIGYFLEKCGEIASFNVKDLENGFRNARERVPSNIGDKITKNIKNGHMDEAKEKRNGLKAWYLTNSGERFIENDFKKEE